MCNLAFYLHFLNQLINPGAALLAAVILILVIELVHLVLSQEVCVLDCIVYYKYALRIIKIVCFSSPVRIMSLYFGKWKTIIQKNLNYLICTGKKRF